MEHTVVNTKHLLSHGNKGVLALLGNLLYQDNMNAVRELSNAADAVVKAPRVRQVPALSRGIAILHLLGHSDEPLGVHAIARQLRLVPSTCLHILRVLVEEDLVVVDPSTKKYTVGPGLVALARLALRQNTFAAVVQKDLDDLARIYGATALGVEASGLEHMVVVALARSESPLRIHVEIGSRFPALISATGRCVAAFGEHSWADIEARFAKLRWDVPPALAAWRAEVRATQKAGYAVDDGQYIRGVCIVAGPVRMTNGSVNALVVVGIREQMARAGPTKIGQDLRQRADRISQLLGARRIVTGSLDAIRPNTHLRAKSAT